MMIQELKRQDRI